ncbi:hypothetical protein FRB96_001326 [Tulasnella sp. 330]|nr:hypothetical protein FRB96_001326 [Tulasnella sp. 330]
MEKAAEGIIWGLTKQNLNLLPAFYNTEEIFAALGELQSLEEVGVWDLHDMLFQEDLHANRRKFLEDTFRRLMRFEMDNTLQGAAEIICSNTPAWLSLTHPQIYHEATNSQFEYSPSVLATSYREALLFESLQPLLLCPEMAFFEIVHNLPMILSEQSVVVMAVAWPLSSTLIVTLDLVDLQTPNPNNRSATHLSVLRAFSQ